jgi:hypothetical protein
MCATNKPKNNNKPCIGSSKIKGEIAEQQNNGMYKSPVTTNNPFIFHNRAPLKIK